MDPHFVKHPGGKCKVKFDAAAYVSKQAKVCEVELERECAIQAECRRLVDKAARLAEARKLELLSNDDGGETWQAE